MPTRRPARTPTRRGARGRVPRAAVVAVAALASGLAGLAWLSRGLDRPRRLRERAEAASLARDWPSALGSWRAYNEAGPPDSRSLLAEARSALALDRGAEAGRAIEAATRADPADAGAWLARLDRLRLLDRPLEVMQVGRAALEAVPTADRRAVLGRMTLALLAGLPEDQARDRLGRWIAADPNDLDARVARLARIAAEPRPGDPDRAMRIAELAAILAKGPAHVPAREALVVALADAGEPDRGREVLDAWPPGARDARHDRLRARWDLDYDRRPDRAAEGYRRALADLPHDWKSHYGLARALRAIGRDPEARREADAVARLRERLDPATLGPRLARLDDPRAPADLADLCRGAGLADLARAWAREAATPPVDR